MKNVESTLVSKINTLPELLQKVARWKAEGQKLVFTNGVFDLIHTGHITYLAQAAELGHKLIIGLNSDASVKRLKGEGRPVNHQDSRALLLSAFFFIDAIVIFGEDTPANLINAVMPDVLVKGGDYTIENIVGANEVMANGGEVKTINFVEGYSSTSIINKIRGRSS
jgi:rfaE bifunctional protein nucleotidyltransferase chain/domain